jgi:phage regulator Rha-like protein
MFQLAAKEPGNLRFQFETSSSTHGGRRYRPYAFTEQGIAMLSSVLNSERAVQMNIAIMRAFVKLREAIGTNRELARKFAELEARVGRHDGQLNAIMQAIRRLMTPLKQPRREIGFHVHDASGDQPPKARRR